MQFMKVDLKLWVFGTIERVQRGEGWNHAWFETYKSLGGDRDTSGNKVCPRAAAKTLYFLGRIKGSGMPFQNPPLRDVEKNYSKNGVYAILALEGLSKYPDILKDKLWSYVQKRYRDELGEKLAESDQGGCKVTFKLWHLGLIEHQQRRKT